MKGLRPQWHFQLFLLPVPLLCREPPQMIGSKLSGRPVRSRPNWVTAGVASSPLPRLALVKINRTRFRGTSSRDSNRRSNSATSAPPAPRYIWASSRTRMSSFAGSRAKPIASLLEYWPLDGPHKHIFEHRVVGDEYFRAANLRFVARHQFAVADLSQ